ncbi:hypothetical protein KIN20_006154 [Parelaphostrongylus tenuis]|uniref:Uncharacterized protein n=1 Tax=Parelaphostrongylus tenuis TaxID=148309 RepID=A0AAD5MJR4_PARTN|nr:hypothetical protein KIN20_006154 [Parelaphostrongylus tenuis]
MANTSTSPSNIYSEDIATSVIIGLKIFVNDGHSVQFDDGADNEPSKTVEPRKAMDKLNIAVTNTFATVEKAKKHEGRALDDEGASAAPVCEDCNL